MLDLGKIFIIISIYILQGCGPAPSERFYQSIALAPIFSDSSGYLYFSHQNSQADFVLHKRENHTWNIIDTNLSFIPEWDLSFARYNEEKGVKIAKDTFLSYENNKIFIKHDSNVTVEDALPDKNTIVANLNIDIINGFEIEYMPFFTAQYKRNRTKHIVSIATDKTVKTCVGCTNDGKGGAVNTYSETYKIYATGD